MLRVWDPAALKEAAWRLKPLGAKVVFAHDEYDAITGADALVILTEWNQFRNLDLDLVKTLLKSPQFFDLRNIYQALRPEAKGFRYSAWGGRSVLIFITEATMSSGQKDKTSARASKNQDHELKDQGWTMVIKPKRRWMDINIRELIRYRDLIWMFVNRDFVTVYKQTILGRPGLF